MDANTYFLGQHMDELDEAYAREDRAEDYAREQIADPTSDFYPWTKENLEEAIIEISVTDLKRLISEKDDASGSLANTFREIVERYWYEHAKEEFEGLND